VQRFSNGRKTILVELDLERACLAKRLGLAREPGVTSVLRGEASLEGCLQWVDPELAVLVAGESAADLADLTANLPSSNLLRGLEFACDVVVVDLPPLANAPFAADIARLCEETLLVVAAGMTTLGQVRHGAAILGGSPPVILNRVAPSGPRWLSRMLDGEP
jgi:tyrosine-protein kinase Etk/Wzc